MRLLIRVVAGALVVATVCAIAYVGLPLLMMLIVVPGAVITTVVFQLAGDWLPVWATNQGFDGPAVYAAASLVVGVAIWVMLIVVSLALVSRWRHELRGDKRGEGYRSIPADPVRARR